MKAEYQRNGIQKTIMETPFMIPDHAITNKPVIPRVSLARSNRTFTTSDKRRSVGECNYAATTSLTAKLVRTRRVKFIALRALCAAIIDTKVADGEAPLSRVKVPDSRQVVSLEYRTDFIDRPRRERLNRRVIIKVKCRGGYKSP
jgi:hypothetical protein